MGLTGYYRRFIPNYATIAAGITDLLRKPTFSWTAGATISFHKLKEAMASLVTLTLPDFTDSFEVTTDASNIAIGTVLSQKDHPIAFFSKRLCSRMQVASAYIRELFAIIEAVKKWRQYLIARRFQIFTDQRSLKHLLSQVVQMLEQYKWATKLLGYDFEIIYKPDKENIVADALSRIDQPHILALSATDPSWISDLRSFYNTTDGKNLVQKILNKSTGSDTFHVHNGLLYHH